MEAAQVVEGNASMSLTKLKVKDEGTYICTVSVGVFRGQQVIQLHVIRKFHFNQIYRLRNILRFSSSSSSGALLFRTAAGFTPREVDFKFRFIPDAELPVQ